MPAPVPAGSRWWTLTAVCLATFMLLLDVTIVNVALPDVQASLGSSFAGLQWVVDGYALTLAALLLTAGSLADIVGRRRTYLAGLVVFTAASALCGAARTTLMLQLGRGLQGVGGAVLFTVSLALLASTFHGTQRGAAFGIWGAVTGVAVAVGPVAGGLLVTGLSWRWIFLVNIPVGIVALSITLTKVAESRNPAARRPDWTGLALFTASLGAGVYALIDSGRAGFTDPGVLACCTASVALLAGFVVVELRSDAPMLELSLFRLPTFCGAALAAFGISAGVFSTLLYLTLYLQDVLRYSALATGLRLLVLSAAVLVVSTVAGRLSSHVPVRFLVGPGLVLVGAGLLLMRGLDAGTGWAHLVPGLIAAGAGIGMVNPPLASAAVGVVRPQLAGMASGINSTFRQVGIAAGIALLGTLFSARLDDVVRALTAGTALAARSGQLSAAIRSGTLDDWVRAAPPRRSALVEQVAATAFTSALDRILLVAAVLSLVAGVLAAVLIRGRDFAPAAPRPTGNRHPADDPATASHAP